MSKSAIESIFRIPLLLPLESSGRLKKEINQKSSGNNFSAKKEIEPNNNSVNNDEKEKQLRYSRGYIKYPVYDFF